MGEKRTDGEVRGQHAWLAALVEEQRVSGDVLKVRADGVATIVRDVIARLRARGWYAEYGGPLGDLVEKWPALARRRNASLN
jgi:hypothetical protein